MFSELPEKIKQDILFYLEIDFPKAKAIYDNWLKSRCSPRVSEETFANS